MANFVNFFRFITVFGLCWLIGACSLIKYAIEHAPYTVIESHDEIEVRHYTRLLWAKTSITSLGDQTSGDSAFRRLFGYISGNNRDAREISMTAPVFMDEHRETFMSFVLPAEVNRDTTPPPLDESVDIEEITDLTVAVIRFNGRLDAKTIIAEKLELEKWLKQRQIEPRGNPIIAGYDPPSAIPWFRRNEVLIPIQPSDI